MLFHHVDFILFFIVTLVVYAALFHKLQNLWLLAASYVFYGMWDWRFIGLLLASTFINFFGSWIIEDSRKKYKLIWIIIVVFLNITLLAFFKYAIFIQINIFNLFHFAGFDFDRKIYEVVNPIGISFFTFQGLSYVIDVYRGTTKARRPTEGTADLGLFFSSASRHFCDVALYISFFPQLIAGPIERSTTLLPQVLAPRRLTWERTVQGIWFFLLGLALKTGIADPIGRLVDGVYVTLSAATLLKLYVATIAFAIQILCDFAGYTYMARGLGRMMGFELHRNFLQPYFATSFSDFWSRWHVSLSQWFRDYVYIPLGGSRVSALRTYRNLLGTMLIVGFWHGATWGFIAWGALHGIFLAVERYIGRLIDRLRKRGHAINFPFMLRIAYGIVVFHGVLAGWFLFRTGSLSPVITYVTEFDPANDLGTIQDLYLTIPQAYPFLGFMFYLLLYEFPNRMSNNELLPRDFNPMRRFLLYLLPIVLILASGGQNDSPFIYFQF